MGVTIKQIAELANVSRGTVDKVLNHRPGVKAETKAKVLQIAKELNYQPNFLGKALVQSKEPTKLGIILTPDYNPYIQAMLKGINQAKEEFAPFNLDISVKMLATLEPAELVNLLTDMSTDSYDGIAVFPIDDEQVKTKINQLTEQGIVIITFNSKIDGIHDLCFLGQDHVQGGAVAAGLMGRLLPCGGQIGIIISSHNLSCHQCRLEGFQQKLKQKYSNFDIVEIRENQDHKEEAFKITLEYCNKYPELKGLYITGGGIIGVGRALDIARKSEKLKVICHDLVPDTITLLQNGTVDFAIGQNASNQGYQLVKILFDYIIKRQKPNGYYMKIPITIATEDTIDYFEE
ncbi:MAG: substrate-binding domain-containing protein [Lachnospiraceae bacterium]|jgi:LacI family transcriptional regulator|nr:substrate-binding domain-containing protein [Lachnospiraceae bacterium]